MNNNLFRVLLLIAVLALTGCGTNLRYFMDEYGPVLKAHGKVKFQGSEQAIEIWDRPDHKKMAVTESFRDQMQLGIVQGSTLWMASTAATPDEMRKAVNEWFVSTGRRDRVVTIQRFNKINKQLWEVTYEPAR